MIRKNNTTTTIFSGYSFKTCGHTGRTGPTQYQCDSFYEGEEEKIRVLGPPLSGIQVWTVPENNIYSITALGAAGGAGVQNPQPSKGGYANAKFNLTKGTEVFMLIGQRGQSACSRSTDNMQTSELCRHGDNASKISDIEVKGGGGGGGTYVFVKDKENLSNFIPLVIAGGGGGRSAKQNANTTKSDGGLTNNGTGLNAPTIYHAGPGSGGGWRGLTTFNISGQSLLKGGIGGLPCAGADPIWLISGGFGGGGGGCTSGGGGGGYTGGNVSGADDPYFSGEGGSSYINDLGISHFFEPATQLGDGEVEIAAVLPCACEFMCIYQNYEDNVFRCFCPPNAVLADDGLRCIDKRMLQPKEETDVKLNTRNSIIIGGTVAIVLCILFMFILIVYRKKRYKASKHKKMLSITDQRLGLLQPASIMTEYNPNYDFGGMKCSLSDLSEISRDHLAFSRALGQGAFGEVYQGELKINGYTETVPVAIKTLSSFSTNQAEMDFIMEALIMSKFDHHNIVHFIGVCFDKSPRFIVLELLEGGDLKTFLRECRPFQNKVPVLNNKDLIKLSLDIAFGCKYLEDNHFIHRDIAARNCLLTTKGPDRVAKIADFGMARDIYRADYYKKSGKAMLPVKWMPPEAYLDGMFTSKTDVWSFGVLMWEVFSYGFLPYPGKSNHEVMQFVASGGRLEQPYMSPPPVYRIMNMCWNRIYELRPAFETLITHLQFCLTDPEVENAPLPIFNSYLSDESDITSDQSVIAASDPPTSGNSLSDNSAEQLLPMNNPDYDAMAKLNSKKLKHHLNAMKKLQHNNNPQNCSYKTVSIEEGEESSEDNSSHLCSNCNRSRICSDSETSIDCKSDSSDLPHKTYHSRDVNFIDNLCSTINQKKSSNQSLSDNLSNSSNNRSRTSSFQNSDTKIRMDTKESDKRNYSNCSDLSTHRHSHPSKDLKSNTVKSLVLHDPHSDITNSNWL